MARGLGITAQITSPTYALENRYENTLLHADLYRLEPAEAKRMVEESENFPGVRVIEWSERVEEALENNTQSPSIHIAFQETTQTERTLHIDFCDLPLPDQKHIAIWRTEVRLPENVAKHCHAVGVFAEQCAQELLRRGIICRPHTLRIAGELHDLLRFVDFRDDVAKRTPGTVEPDEETKKIWQEWKDRYADCTHEEACARFLIERGYPELGVIIRPHGLHTLEHAEAFTTIEQKILTYADKRVQNETVVSLDERFDDFVRRYGDGVESAQTKIWRELAKKVEEELFGDTPFAS